jgi:hypothetical protein
MLSNSVSLFTDKQIIEFDVVFHSLKDCGNSCAKCNWMCRLLGLIPRVKSSCDNY